MARAPCTSGQAYDLSSEPDGVYTFTVWAVDSSGTSSSPTTDKYTLATLAKALTGTGLPPGTAGRSGQGPTTGSPTQPARHRSIAGAGHATRLHGTPTTHHVHKSVPPAAHHHVHQPAPPAGNGTAPPVPRAHSGRSLWSEITSAIGAAFKAIVRNADKAVLPLILLILVAVFLSIQNQIDRSDPKLALAPVFADPDIEFRSPSSQDHWL